MDIPDETAQAPLPTEAPLSDNSSTDVTSLPPLPWEEQLDRAVVWVWILTDSIVFVIAAILSLGSYTIFAESTHLFWIPYLSIPLLCTILANIILQPASRRSWRIYLAEDEIRLRHGVVFRQEVLLPINRIQHVDTYQGPIERSFGLQSLKIATAAEILKISGLRPEQVERMRQMIVARVKMSSVDI